MCVPCALHWVVVPTHCRWHASRLQSDVKDSRSSALMFIIRSLFSAVTCIHDARFLPSALLQTSSTRDCANDPTCPSAGATLTRRRSPGSRTSLGYTRTLLTVCFAICVSCNLVSSTSLDLLYDFPGHTLRMRSSVEDSWSLRLYLSLIVKIGRAHV